ncbi:MAG TPA: hypothetical protein VM662_10090 [Sphingomonas sp.]|nr:hypothetical protein [Sphingomonas sp.]
MSNDFESKAWSDSHGAMSDGVGALFHKLIHAFKRLNAIEYDAPWQREADRTRDTLPHPHPSEDSTIGRAATFR